MEKYGGWIGLALLCTAFTLLYYFWQSDSFTFGNVLLFIGAILAAMMGLIFLGTRLDNWLNKEAK
jgi:hypothetical protein